MSFDEIPENLTESYPCPICNDGEVTKNEKGEQFTERRILEYAAPEGNSPEKFLGLMLDHVKEFRGTAAQSDDITMLAIKYLAAE